MYSVLLGLGVGSPGIIDYAVLIVKLGVEY
jgi:hypothetical protein